MLRWKLHWVSTSWHQQHRLSQYILQISFCLVLKPSDIFLSTPAHTSFSFMSYVEWRHIYSMIESFITPNSINDAQHLTQFGRIILSSIFLILLFAVCSLQILVILSKPMKLSQMEGISRCFLIDSWNTERAKNWVVYTSNFLTFIPHDIFLKDLTFIFFSPGWQNQWFE